MTAQPLNRPTYDKRFTFTRGPLATVQHRVVRWRGHSCEYVQSNTTGHWVTVATFSGTPSIANAARALGYSPEIAVEVAK